MATKKYLSLDKLGLYDQKIKKVISDGDKATLDAAKEYSDETLTLANNNAASLANTAESNAKTYTNAEVAKANAAAAAAQTAADNAAAAAATADGKAVAAQTDVDNLESYVGTFTASEGVDTVVKYIDAKTANIASDETVTAIADRVTQAEKDIDAIEADYLKAADKTELSTAINTEKERAMGVESGLRTDVDAIADDYLKAADKTELANAVAAEKTRAEGIEGGLRTDVDAIKADYLKAADKESLQTQINTIMNNPDAEGAINSINEFTKYVEDHGTIAEGFRTDIDKNKTDIAAEVKRAGEAESALSDRLDTLEAIDHDAYVAADTALKNELTTEIGKKADASALTSAIDSLEAADTGLGNRITALETAVGDGGSVDEMISDAIDTEAARVDGELDKKVDKVEGYGLSKNDLSDALKVNYDAAYAHSQVAHAPANAQENKIETVKVNGTAVTITDKAVDIAVPTKVSELTNDVPYLVASDIANKADKATTLAGYGIGDAYTKTEADTAIANAVGQFVEISEEEINKLFQA